MPKKGYLKFMQGFIVFFLILYFCSAFAQEKKGILPFYPLAKSDLLIESEAKSLKNTIKKDHFFSELIAYKAVRENDLLICNNAGNSLNCKMLAENLFSVRRMVEGNCELINERNYRDVCFKYKEKNCSALSDWKKDVCEGFLQENIDLLEGASTFPSYKREVSERGETSKSDRLEVMASFLGFKYYNSKMACEKFGSRLPLKKKFICEVLFSTNDVDEILDKIAYDIALFTLAKQYRNTKVCEKIKDRDIKNGCLDSKVRYIQDIW